MQRKNGMTGWPAAKDEYKACGKGAFMERCALREVSCRTDEIKISSEGQMKKMSQRHLEND